MAKKYFIPAKTDIELTGTVAPYFNSYLSPSYMEGTSGQLHYGMDCVPGKYTAIGKGKVEYANPYDVGGGVVIRHEWSDTHDLFALFWHGKPLVKVGDEVTEEVYVTDSRIPDKSIGKMGNHTHFEVRIVEKGKKFKYHDPARPCQAKDPFSLLYKRSSKVKIGDKLCKNLAYKGIEIKEAAVNG